MDKYVLAYRRCVKRHHRKGYCGRRCTREDRLHEAELNNYCCLLQFIILRRAIDELGEIVWVIFVLPSIFSGRYISRFRRAFDRPSIENLRCWNLIARILQNCKWRIFFVDLSTNGRGRSTRWWRSCTLCECNSSSASNACSVVTIYCISSMPPRLGRSPAFSVSLALICTMMI